MRARSVKGGRVSGPGRHSHSVGASTWARLWLASVVQSAQDRRPISIFVSEAHAVITAVLARLAGCSQLTPLPPPLPPSLSPSLPPSLLPSLPPSRPPSLANTVVLPERLNPTRAWVIISFAVPVCGVWALSFIVPWWGWLLVVVAVTAGAKRLTAIADLCLFGGGMGGMRGVQEAGGTRGRYVQPMSVFSPPTNG